VSAGSKCACLPEGDDFVEVDVLWVRVCLPCFHYFLMLMPLQCDPCAESKVACCRMLGAGPGFPCQKCYEWKLECERSSLHYLRVFTRQSHTASNPLPPPVLQVCHTSHAASNAVAGSSHRSHLPPLGKHQHTSRDAGYNVPGPAYELLIGREGCYSGLDSVHTALFWHSELEHSKAMINASYCQQNFHRKMLNNALTRCMVLPPNSGPHAKCVKFTGPALPCACTHFGKRCDKGKHHADLEEEEEPQDKGKGHMDPLVSEGDYESAYSGNAEDWFGL
jgi:hypothetical protein